MSDVPPQPDFPHVVDSATPAGSGPFRAWLQLFRLPNVFTALADVGMGYLVTHLDGTPYAVSGALLAASGLLYTAGMVLNDYFDRDIDLVERPRRPIPSGRVSSRAAAWTGLLMLLAGAALGWIAGAAQMPYQDALQQSLGERPPADVAQLLSPSEVMLRAGFVATLLAAAVILYDRILKRTPLAPLAMGLCRFLNVLLGMSTAATSWQTMHWLIAAGIGTYIVGVTLFARTEARASGRGQLLAGLGLMAAGFWLLDWFPSQAASQVDALGPAGPLGDPMYALSDPARWHLFWCVTGALVGWRCLRAIWEPIPAHVQAAVKHCILSLIVLDAAACWAFAGPMWAGAILLLLLPAMFLGQWIYST